MTDVEELSATEGSTGQLTVSPNLSAAMHALTLEYLALELHVFRYVDAQSRITLLRHKPNLLPFRFAIVRQLTLTLTDMEITQFLTFAEQLLKQKREASPNVPYQAKFERFYIDSSFSH
jgi:hypothetical protein